MEKERNSPQRSCFEIYLPRQILSFAMRRSQVRFLSAPPSKSASEIPRFTSENAGFLCLLFPPTRIQLYATCYLFLATCYHDKSRRNSRQVTPKI